MFVVAGVTGKTGRVVAETLLARKQPVRVIVRESKQAGEWRERGAEIAVTSLDDLGGVTHALMGARGAYVLIPPQYRSDDMIAAQREVTDTIARAVHASAIPHVVLLSSFGAQHARGTGPVRSLHHAERVIGNAARNLTIVRAAYFLENWAAALTVAESSGVLPSFLPLGGAVPMVASADVGRVAAEALLDARPGHRVIELAGSALTPEDVAVEIAGALGRGVRAEELPLERVVPTLTRAGMSADAARLFEEMYRAIRDQRLVPAGGKAEARRAELGPAQALGILAHAMS